MEERLSKEQVILFGDYDVLQAYRNSVCALGYTVLWGNRANRLRVLFAQLEIIRRCEEMGCDYLVLPAVFASQSLIDKAKSRRIKVWVYGTDDEFDLRYLAGRGIDGFISDRPKRAKTLFAETDPTRSASFD